MAIYPKVKGAYKEMTDCKVKVKGAWKQGAKMLTKVKGAWKECWVNLELDTIINYGITNIPVKSEGLYMRLYGLYITIKSTSDGKVLQTITVEDTEECLSLNYALNGGGSLSISTGNDRNSLDFELWQSGAKAEVKIKKIELS